MDQNASNSGSRRVECPAARDPAVRLFILAAMLLGFGAWCVVDHYIQGHYPYPEPYRLDGYLKYAFNHYAPIVLIPLGLYVVLRGGLFLRRRLVADSDGIGYTGKPKLRWSEVTELDAALLKPKGILVLRHGDGKKLKLDSWKLQNFRELVAHIEQHVPQDKRAQ